jgi:hypothetical protein
MYAHLDAIPSDKPGGSRNRVTMQSIAATWPGRGSRLAYLIIPTVSAHLAAARQDAPPGPGVLGPAAVHGCDGPQITGSTLSAGGYPATPLPGWTVCTDRICTEVLAQARAFRLRYRGLVWPGGKIRSRSAVTGWQADAE